MIFDISDNDDRDSLDEFIALSQAARQGLEDSDNDDDDNIDDNNIDDEDSFNDMVSQADENEYLNVDKSPKSKVNDWLNTNPQSLEKENTEKAQVAKRAKTSHRKFEVDNHYLQSRAQNHPMAGSSSGLSPFEQMNALEQQRQAFFCNFWSREQDLQKQKLDMMKNMSKKPKNP